MAKCIGGISKERKEEKDKSRSGETREQREEIGGTGQKNGNNT